jgi:hypothetical protein
VFEGGKLEYESIILKEMSSANLTITDFKVSKVPALAQLLTLASLQGIADTLSGEGIRFETFEMKSNAKDSSIIKLLPLEFDFISKVSKRIPSPLRVSAIPCKEAKVSNCAKAGTFETLKSVIVKFALDISIKIIDSYSNFPPSKPSIKSKFLIKGLARSETT